MLLKTQNILMICEVCCITLGL